VHGSFSGSRLDQVQDRDRASQRARGPRIQRSAGLAVRAAACTSNALAGCPSANPILPAEQPNPSSTFIVSDIQGSKVNPHSNEACKTKRPRLAAGGAEVTETFNP